MRKFSAVLIGATLVAASFGASAGSSKIGVVDLQKIMQTAPQMKVITKSLEVKFKPRRDKLMAMEQNMKTQMEKFKRDVSIMSDSQKQAFQKKVMGEQQKFEKEGQAYQQELNKAHNEEMGKLYAKVNDAIKKLASSDKYDLILQKDAAPFSSNNLDVTSRIMKELK